MKRPLFAVLLLVVIAGCSDGSDGANRLDVQAFVGNTAAEVTARVQQPGRVQTLSDAQVNTRYRTGSPTLIKTQKYGSMIVEIVAVVTPADTIAIGAVTLALGDGFAYSVSASRQPAGSPNYCFGCNGVKKFPFRGSERGTTDSLSIYYSALKPCKDCVY